MDIVSQLSRLLERRESELEPLLAEAKKELRVVQERAAELRQLIEKAESPEGTETLTLHEAMGRVLAGEEEPCLRARVLAEAINGSGLYRKRDGSAVDTAQIHARARNYDELFVKTEEGICMRHDYFAAELQESGAREGTLVTVVDRETEKSMTIAVRVSYTALATRADSRLPIAALQKARDLIARGRFQDKSHIDVMLTSNGWIESSDA